jgi:hypothetical protein
MRREVPTPSGTNPIAKESATQCERVNVGWGVLKVVQACRYFGLKKDSTARAMRREARGLCHLPKCLILLLKGRETGGKGRGRKLQGRKTVRPAAYTAGGRGLVPQHERREMCYLP